jgi:hypothetical protein
VVAGDTARSNLAQLTSQLCLGSWVLVVHGVLASRSGMAALTRLRSDLTPEAQHSEEKEADPVWAFAQLRRLGLGFMTVSHADLVGLIRIPCSSSHPQNPISLGASRAGPNH